MCSTHWLCHFLNVTLIKVSHFLFIYLTIEMTVVLRSVHDTKNRKFWTQVLQVNTCVWLQWCLRSLAFQPWMRWHTKLFFMRFLTTLTCVQCIVLIFHSLFISSHPFSYSSQPPLFPNLHLLAHSCTSLMQSVSAAVFMVAATMLYHEDICQCSHPLALTVFIPPCFCSILWVSV